MTDAEVTTAITNLADGTPNTVAEFRALFTELFSRTPKTGTIVIKDVSNAYITANFDGTGLGINIEAGYALVNGANGTRDWAGRVPVAYGTGYTTMGERLGSKDAVVVAHRHGAIIQSFNENNSGNPFGSGGGGQEAIHTYAGNGNPFTVTETGVSGVNKNMQPYIVTLVTMKL